MNTLLLISSLLCACQCAPAASDDSAETTTATGDTSVSTGPIDFDAFDADMDDIYKNLAQIKSKASKLELIGPKIQDAMLHLAGDEEDNAKKLQAKYEQILPLLKQLKIDDTITQKSAAANRRRRNVTPDLTASESTIAETGSTDTGNTEPVNSDFTTESVTSAASTADVTVNADSSANVTSSSTAPSSSPSA